ncbi:MAG: MFS transporter, partial [Actinomycetota bacterium]
AARRASLLGVSLAVAVAFADSSIVVLALPELYARFDTTIEGVAWVITSYNLVVAVGALVLVAVVHRQRARALLAAGALVFLGASIACAAAGSLPALVAARSAQGLGAALLLAGSLPVLAALAGSSAGGVAAWTTAGTFGAAVGPALGGALTQAFDWRAIFLAQAPVAGAAVFATIRAHEGAAEAARPLRPTLTPNAGLALAFGALVGALFLGVLLVIAVFGYEPLVGAAVVSVIPVAALAVRPVAAGLPIPAAAGGGAVVLAGGLVGLALLPSAGPGWALASFALCGAGLGLSVPGLTRSALGGGTDARLATLTVGIRHLGLVLAVAVVAPLLARDLIAASRIAELNATAVVIDGRIPATTKIPLALDIRDALDRAPRGEIPDLSAPFDEHGASTDANVRRVRDDLVETATIAITRGFRRSFVFCALLAAVALAPALGLRRRPST